VIYPPHIECRDQAPYPQPHEFRELPCPSRPGLALMIVGFWSLHLCHAITASLKRRKTSMCPSGIFKPASVVISSACVAPRSRHISS
jgi:hypothetical protein